MDQFISLYYQRTLEAKRKVEQDDGLKKLLRTVIQNHFTDPRYPGTSSRRIDGRATEQEGLHHYCYRIPELSFPAVRASALKIPITIEEFNGAYHYFPRRRYSPGWGTFLQAQLGALEAKLERRDHEVPYFVMAVLHQGLLSLLTEDLTRNGTCTLRTPDLFDSRIEGLLFYSCGMVQTDANQERLIWCSMAKQFIHEDEEYLRRGKKYLEYQALVEL